MKVFVGNPHPIEILDHEVSPVRGHQRTEIVIPEGKDYFSTTLAVLNRHMFRGTGPSSLFCSDPTLTNRLRAYFNLGGVPAMTNIRTSAGADFQASVMGSTSSNGTGLYSPACYLGVTADSTTPSVSDTVLPNEVTAGSLIRAKTTYAHTTGTTSFTQSNIFTSDQNIILNKDGLFNSSSGGSPFWEELFPVSRALQNGDQLSLTITLNI